MLSSLIIENLPDYEYSFSPVEINGVFNGEQIYAYSDLVYDFGREKCGSEPYQYGAYEIY